MSESTGAGGGRAAPGAVRVPSAPAGPAGRRAATPLPRGRAARAVLAVALVVCLAATGWHLLMVFLSVAPANAASNDLHTAVGTWVYPEFEQNWQLFAPNPMSENTHVEARQRVALPGGGTRVTSWQDLTAEDIAAIHHNPAPSHVNQNMLRRAWDFYASTHNTGTEAGTTNTAPLASSYLLGLAKQRIDRPSTGRVTQVQLRAVSLTIPPPGYAPGASPSASPQRYVRQLPWWPVDAPAGTLR